MSNEQLSLFANVQPETAHLQVEYAKTAHKNANSPLPMLPRRVGGAPRSVDAAWERAYSPACQRAMVLLVNSRIGQWLGWSDFDAIRTKYDIGCCMGHALGALERAGRIAEKRVYYGAERPGMKEPYLGFNCLWGSIEHGPAVDHVPRRRP